MTSNSILLQFDIKFYTKNEFKNIIEKEFQIPETNIEQKIALEYAVGQVLFDFVQDSVIINWDPIQERTMAKMLGLYLLQHDNTSFAIFSSLIKHLQKQFYSCILYEESFKLHRAIYENEYENYENKPEDEIAYDVNLNNKKLINTVVMKASARRELKYLYGRIVLPLIKYVFTLKPKVDISILNTFYKENQEHLDIYDAATAAPNDNPDTPPPPPPFLPDQTFDIIQPLNQTYVFGETNQHPSSYDNIKKSDNKELVSEQDHTHQSESSMDGDKSNSSDDSDYFENTIIPLHITPNKYIQSARELEEKEFIEQTLNISIDEQSRTPIAPKTNRQDLDEKEFLEKTFNILLPEQTSTPIVTKLVVSEDEIKYTPKINKCNINNNEIENNNFFTKIKPKKLKRKHQQSKNHQKKKKLYEFETNSDDSTNTDSSFSSLVEFNINNHNQTNAVPSEISSFNRRFDKLTLNIDPVVELLNNFYNNYFISNEEIHLEDMKKTWEQITNYMIQFKIKNKYVDDGKTSVHLKSMVHLLGDDKYKHNIYEMFYRNAKSNYPGNIVAFYSFIRYKLEDKHKNL